MAKILRRLFWTATAVAGGLTVINKVIEWNAPALGNRLGGGFNRYPARYGDIAYSVAGSGPPLLLLHAMWPGDSSAEWAENFEELARHFTVYAPDFLGWGLSDMPHHVLRAKDYTEQILHFVEDVIAARESTPVATISSGHACTFALLAAAARPELFTKLILVCPSSQTGDAPSGEKAIARCRPALRLLSLSILGRTLVNFLTTRRRMEKFAAQQLLFDRAAAGKVLSRWHAAAQRPGACYALASSLAGCLGSDWKRAWESLPQPMLLVWAREAQDEGFETVPEWLALRPSADLEVFDHALRLPHLEHPAEWNARVLKWLRP